MRRMNIKDAHTAYLFTYHYCTTVQVNLQEQKYEGCSKHSRNYTSKVFSDAGSCKLVHVEQSMGMSVVN